ncbi:hypothetical protein [Parasitella parasitica]|uniref:Uncharacterized protein n=1 Tax=Parasitella parasitica TaxID=35722 RepID=A0A0B7NEQ9_9FUNG|nr:hypothetical protein [Parasitella parasitica]
MFLPKSLQLFLESDKVVKMGRNVSSDLKKIERDLGFASVAFKDHLIWHLNAKAKEESQVSYAAKDAFVSIDIFRAMENLEVVGAPVDRPSRFIEKYIAINNKYASERAKAYGFVVEEKMVRPKMWIKAVINVTEVCVPRAFIAGEDKSLEALGQVPFHIMVDLAYHSLFSRKLRDALFVNDIDDEAMIRSYLDGLPDEDPNKMTFDQLIKKRPGWVLKRIRRHDSPQPVEVATEVQALFDTYQDSKCAISGGLPLFDKRCKKVASNVLETMKEGHVSDPPGVCWCTRGTNSIEGSVHQNIVRKFASFNASPALTDCVLVDYRLRHNIQLGSKNRYGMTYRSHFSPWIRSKLAMEWHH